MALFKSILFEFTRMLQTEMIIFTTGPHQEIWPHALEANSTYGKVLGYRSSDIDLCGLK